MPSVEVVRAETVNKGVNADLFDPFSDPIVLRMTISFSPDFLKLNPIYQSSYQIIEFASDTVFEQWIYQSVPGGTDIYEWVTLPSAYALGLNWTKSTIFGFRGAVELFSNAGASGLLALDAVAVTDVHWFRLEPLYLL